MLYQLIDGQMVGVVDKDFPGEDVCINSMTIKHYFVETGQIGELFTMPYRAGLYMHVFEGDKVILSEVKDNKLPANIYSAITVGEYTTVLYIKNNTIRYRKLILSVFENICEVIEDNYVSKDCAPYRPTMENLNVIRTARFSEDKNTVTTVFVYLDSKRPAVDLTSIKPYGYMSVCKHTDHGTYHLDAFQRLSLYKHTVVVSTDKDKGVSVDLVRERVWHSNYSIEDNMLSIAIHDGGALITYRLLDSQGNLIKNKTRVVYVKGKDVIARETV